METVRTRRAANDLRYTVKARQHEITTDAEINDGGTDLGATPHELLAAALAGCTSITVQMYANRKGGPLKSCDTEVRLTSGEKTDVNSPTVFEVKVWLEGELTVEQRERLLEIANRCPVHRALTRPISIRVSAGQL